MNRIVVLVLLAFAPSLALGATYKCVDAQGRVSYSQTPEAGKRCVEAVLPPLQVVPAPSLPQRARAPSAGDSGQSSDQPKASEQDIAAAKKALEEARKKLAEQEELRYGDERNYQRVLDRLKPYQEAVANAEARLKQLQDSASQGTLSPKPAETGKY
jgi:hypothetical protein